MGKTRAAPTPAFDTHKEDLNDDGFLERDYYEIKKLFSNVECKKDI